LIQKLSVREPGDSGSTSSFCLVGRPHMKYSFTLAARAVGYAVTNVRIQVLLGDHLVVHLSGSLGPPPSGRGQPGAAAVAGQLWAKLHR